MIVNMSRNATQEQIDHVIERIKECGYPAARHPRRRTHRHRRGRQRRPARRARGSAGRARRRRADPHLAAVQAGEPRTAPRMHRRQRRRREIGGEHWVVMRRAVLGGVARAAAGARREPCAIAGASMLRGGAYKPRTSPYDFQGLGRRSAGIAPGSARGNRAADRDRSDEHRGRGPGLRIRGHAAGGRAQHAEFPACCGGWRARKRPILLKRGPSATVKEWLLAAEYLLSGGNPNVVLCERGIKTFESELRNTFDLAAIRAGQGAVAFAGGRRSVARHGPAQRDSGDEPRGNCRRGGWLDDRSASVPGARAFRRAAIARPEGIRAADAGDGPAGKDASSSGGEGVAVAAGKKPPPERRRYKMRSWV